MRHILSNIKTFCMLAVCAAASLFGTGLSAKESNLSAEPEKTYYIIYHDQNGNVIRRDPFTTGYRFDEMLPAFECGLNKRNYAWKTTPGDDTTGASWNRKSMFPLSPLTTDLDVYPWLVDGFNVIFDSDGGTPVEFQFVSIGDRAIEPSKPKRSGYEFVEWQKDGVKFDFGSVITADTQLKAKWNPKTVSYTVRVWLEKPNRPKRANVTEALNYMYDDFDHGGDFTKTGTTETDVSFTSSDQSRVEYDNIVRKKKIDGSYTYPIPFYFCDDKNSSLALSMTNQSISDINGEGGIQGDGSTVLNVFCRSFYYNFTLSDKKVTNGTTELTYTAPMRDSEFYSSWMERNGINLDSEFREKVYDNPDPYIYPIYLILDGKAFQLNQFRPGFSAWNFININANTSDTVSDGYSLRAEIHSGTVAGPYQVWLFDYVQTIEAAESGDKNFSLDDRSNYSIYKDSKRSYNSIVTSLIGGDRTGGTAYKQQMVRRGKDLNPSLDLPDYAQLTFAQYDDHTFKFFKGFLGTTDVGTNNFLYIDGRCKDVEYGKKFYVAPYKADANFKDMGYVYEAYFTRNAYSLTFDTGTDLINVRDDSRLSKVLWEKPLNTYADAVLSTTDGTVFKADNTEYVNDDGVVMSFKGWYDNVLYFGTPIDFATTDMTMPAKDLVLYAKWEPKTITAKYKANGGKVDGEDVIEMTQASGQIPVRPADPVPADGFVFYCWTLNGKYYDFTSPISYDADLVAQYYSTATGKVTYSAGKGSGSVPVDGYTYLLDANAGVLDPGTAIAPPRGLRFVGWEDSDHNVYSPGDEVIIKGDVTLTAIYEDGNGHIKITRKGLKAGESAIYAIYKFDPYPLYNRYEDTPLMTVSLTGTSEDEVSRTVVRLDPGKYMVKDTSWDWAYDRPGPEIKPDELKVSSTITFGEGLVEYDRTVEFIFTGSEKSSTSTIKRSEDAKANNFTSVP